MTNPKSVLWQLTMFSRAKYYQMTTIFFFILAFLLKVELWIRFPKRQWQFTICLCTSLHVIASVFIIVMVPNQAKILSKQ